MILETAKLLDLFIDSAGFGRLSPLTGNGDIAWCSSPYPKSVTVLQTIFGGVFWDGLPSGNLNITIENGPFIVDLPN